MGFFSTVWVEIPEIRPSCFTSSVVNSDLSICSIVSFCRGWTHQSLIWRSGVQGLLRSCAAFWYHPCHWHPEFLCKANSIAWLSLTLSFLLPWLLPVCLLWPDWETSHGRLLPFPWHLELRSGLECTSNPAFTLWNSRPKYWRQFKRYFHSKLSKAFWKSMKIIGSGKFASTVNSIISKIDQTVSPI